MRKVLFLFCNYLSEGVEGLEFEVEGLLKAWTNLHKQGTQFWFPSPTFIISKPYVGNKCLLEDRNVGNKWCEKSKHSHLCNP